MICPKCNLENTHKNGKTKKGKQKYYCNECNYNFEEGVKPRSFIRKTSTRPKVGISLEEFREKYDVDFIVEKTMKLLDAETIYEKSDVYKLTGLSASYPGLSAAIDNQKEFQGRAGGRTLYSHPKTIEMLKESAKMM